MQITQIEIDDRNEVHLISHGVSIAEVRQVFANHPDVRRNRRNRAGTHVARGATSGGRSVVIPFIDQGAGRIRPITAWEVGK